MSEEKIKVTIKLSNRNNFEIEIERDWTVLKVKEVCSEMANIPVAQQRLIYKGKILKDDEKISNFDIQNGHAMHLVQSQTSSSTPTTHPNTATNSNTTQQQASTTNAGNRRSQTTGTTQPNQNTGMPFMDFSSFGFQFSNNSGTSPGEMPDMSQFMNMMGGMGGSNGQNPMNNQVLSGIMSSILSNPEITRQLMTPEFLQAGQQMAMEMLQRNPNQFFNNAFGQSSGQAGNNTSNNSGAGTGQTTGNTNPNNMFTSETFPPFHMFTMGMQQPNNNNTTNTNPNTNSSNNANASTSNSATTPETGSDNSSNSGANTNFNTQPPNPFMSAFDPNVMQNVMRHFYQNPQLVSNIMSSMNFTPTNDGNTSNNGSGLNANNMNPFDMRRFQRVGETMNNQPPEERFSSQLRSLQEMGFIDAAANIQALQESGGDVNTAITRLLQRGMGN